MLEIVYIYCAGFTISFAALSFVFRRHVEYDRHRDEFMREALYASALWFITLPATFILVWSVRKW